jgi:hypothetical protein
MKLKECARVWPPRVAGGSGTDVGQADLDDVVLSAQKIGEARDHINLRLLTTNGAEYAVPLFLPENVVDKVIMLMIDKRDQTLRHIGELDVP